MSENHKAPFEPLIIRQNIESRLLSSLNPTGVPFLQDDFEAYTTLLTEKWRAGGTIALDTTAPFRGKTCAKLTTAAGVGTNASMNKDIGPIPKSRLGMELWFRSIAGVANIRYVRLEIYYFDGINSHHGGVQWVGTEVGVLMNKWQYLNSLGSYVDIPGGAQKIYVEATWPAYHHAKLVVDCAAEKYTKLVCDDKSFDLSTIPYHKTLSANGPIIIISLAVYTETATAIDLFVDDVILTHKET